MARGKRVLGVDPGSYHLGVGCVEKQGTSFHLISADTLHAPKNLPLFDRLEFLLERLRKIIVELSPDEIAIEDVFFAKNARSAFHLGMARGVAVAACMGRGIKIFEYTPTQVKSVVTGYGRADKEQVKKMIRLILGAGESLGYDATDALAIAICHANSVRLTGLT